VALGLAAVHNIDREGRASIAHTDITPGQYVLDTDNHVYKLNDFNRARFIGWSRTKDKPCAYKVGRNPGTNRSPEEYKYEWQSEKVDVYSMGNIFYMLLVGKWAFEEEEERSAQKLIKAGGRPQVPSEILSSRDPIIQVLLEAMHLCHIHDPKERASARKVATLLKEKLLEVEPHALAEIRGLQKHT
jgi:serine/threonine protein kinase